MNKKGMVISLCDLTGNMVQPWIEAGYDAVLVDPQHAETQKTLVSDMPSGYGGRLIKIAGTLAEAMQILLQKLIPENKIVAVFAFPPCTQFSGSGARWWKAKDLETPWLLEEALEVVMQCETICEAAGAPYFIENPVGRLKRLWGRDWNYTFDPHDYTLFEPNDHYTKKTCLWTGHGFVMPPKARDISIEDAPDDRIHKASPGPERANIRSATPMGFARAVYAANADPSAVVPFMQNARRRSSIKRRRTTRKLV